MRGRRRWGDRSDAHLALRRVPSPHPSHVSPDSDVVSFPRERGRQTSLRAPSPWGEGWGEGMRARSLLSLLAAALLLSPPPHAREIDYDPRRATELRDCDDPHYRGRVQQARDCYRKLLEDSGNVVIQAEAAWALGDTQRANTLFREATNANERSTQPRVRWGRLFLHTHQHADALALFQEALERSQSDVYAKLGMAHVLAEQFEGRLARSSMKC